MSLARVTSSCVIYSCTEDLGMWAGVYEIKLDREQRFLELSCEFLSSLKTEEDKFDAIPTL